MNQQSTLVYKCPHCEAKVEVGDEMLGEVVNCPKCERPFRVEAPPSYPIGDDEAGSVIRKGGAPHVGGPIDQERSLLVLHPAVFRRRIFQSIGSMLLIVGGLVCAVWGAGVGSATLGFGGLIAAVVGGLDLAYWWFKSLYVTLTVTNRRSILRKGLFSKATSEVNHDDVRNIQVEQSVVQRLLNIGDLLISSAGQDIVEIRARAIHDPEAVATIVREHQD
ncbi:PH domain-containing protein [Tautonia plasticadhaerens]|uniref:Bacterial membrane flanked domain protein n=1 Tax=Tautonia plasticadhaerens TaxID=2527974 RepID=A0A518H360_9BACT|nr:PH domain-containing protein [Tautonia plasticadhaerens]QDV35268.1 Bacterial membrane flanked domain protein [Tautonia plasticadhaerens]